MISPLQLDLVRGSHLLVSPPSGLALPEHGLFVEVPGSRRIAFLLPYQGQLLVGTTEERQALSDPVAVSSAEQQQLLGLVERYFPAWLPAPSPFASPPGFRLCAAAPMCLPQAVRRRFTATSGCSRSTAASGPRLAHWPSAWCIMHPSMASLERDAVH